MTIDASADLRSMLGRVGTWSNFDGIDIADVLDRARAVEDLGFGALWINESVGREPFSLLGALAGVTARLTLGLGIASTYARDAVTAHCGARTIAELTGDRFVMGLGVSHRSSVGVRGHEYAPPLATMTAYLDAYEDAPWSGPAVDDPPLVLAALGPRMLGLAATRAAGAFPYLVTVAHVAQARRTLDEAAAEAGRAERPVLVVSQAAILGSGPDVREAARASITRYLGQPNYRNNLLRIGIAPEDIEHVSDALVDALVATGDEATLRERVGEMHAAGADHVAVIPLSRDGHQADLATARALAPR
jgi:probable F420-dependent oxidoreductase